MLEGPTGEDMRDLLLELCMTLPARMSSLLPYLSRLMKPLIICLNRSDGLVSLDLRTLGFWVDSLNPDFPEPSMANVISAVILALRFLKEPLTLECKENPEHRLHLIFTFELATPFSLPLDQFINLAVEAKQALKLLRVCLSSQLNLPGIVADEGCTSKQLSALLADLGVKTKTQLMAEKSVLKILLMTVIVANGEPDLTDPTDDFVVNICRHFAMIFHIDSSSSNTSTAVLGETLVFLAHSKHTDFIMSTEQEETSQVLTQVLRVVNNADEANSEARRQSFQGVVDFLAQELFNQNALNIVRKNNRCIGLFSSLIMQPLKLKTVDQQVGTVTALNFCVALRLRLLKLTPGLVNFLQDALQIAEFDENAWVAKFINQKVVRSLTILQTACIELLCTTMAWADIKTPNHSELRAKISSMFFKPSTYRISEIVAVAMEGLQKLACLNCCPIGFLELLSNL
ncbi:hypothetical protein TSUD_152710 [Trifolium subterraneum]|uniref:Uncharacterized protein n=1 Tax=Trifolium subterraneum TaxID=3900 RepID=A0A2Z6N9I9_TRISU|nr:hypothetical protein TSUD_152710 [Trifolium subterraneum]